MNLNIITPDDATAITEEVKKPENPTRNITRRGKKKPGAVPQVTEDDLYTRLLKYIPTLLIGLYLLLINAALGALNGKAQTVVAWVLFAVFALSIIPFLMTRAVKRRSQIVISVLAFVAWAIASPGPFSLLSGWNAFLNSSEGVQPRRPLGEHRRASVPSPKQVPAAQHGLTGPCPVLDT